MTNIDVGAVSVSPANNTGISTFFNSLSAGTVSVAIVGICVVDITVGGVDSSPIISNTRGVIGVKAVTVFISGIIIIHICIRGISSGVVNSAFADDVTVSFLLWLSLMIVI